MSLNPLSFGVQATLTSARGVAVLADNAVNYPTNTSTLPIGVTYDDVEDTNEGIAVKGPGEIARLQFNDSVAAGGIIQLDSSGRGVPNAGTSGTFFVGVNIGPKVNDTGTVQNILVLPGTN